jgi:hypothetical protein
MCHTRDSPKIVPSRLRLHVCWPFHAPGSRSETWDWDEMRRPYSNVSGKARGMRLPSALGGGRSQIRTRPLADSFDRRLPGKVDLSSTSPQASTVLLA